MVSEGDACRSCATRCEHVTMSSYECMPGCMLCTSAGSNKNVSQNWCDRGEKSTSHHSPVPKSGRRLSRSPERSTGSAQNPKPRPRTTGSGLFVRALCGDEFRTTRKQKWAQSQTFRASNHAILHDNTTLTTLDVQ